MIPGRPALLGWRGRPRPSRTAPLGILRPLLSRSLLICSSLKAAPSPPVPPCRLRKERCHRACALLALWPSLGFGGVSVRTRPVTGAQKPGARVQALVALCLPHGGAQAPSGGCERSDGRRAPPPHRTRRWREEGETAPTPRVQHARRQTK